MNARRNARVSDAFQSIHRFISRFPASSGLRIESLAGPRKFNGAFFAAIQRKNCPYECLPAGTLNGPSIGRRHWSIYSSERVA